MPSLQPARQDSRARCPRRNAMKYARSLGSTRIACRRRTCLSRPSVHSRYTVAVQTRSCAATSRTVRNWPGCSRGSNRVAKFSGSDGIVVDGCDPSSAVSVRFEEGWGVSGYVVGTLFVNSEAEGHWFESSSARHLQLPTSRGGARGFAQHFSLRGLVRRCRPRGGHASASIASKARLASGPPRYPPDEPSLRTTRWQGTTSGTGLWEHALAAARTADGLPAAFATAV
jgi:hypothetical protein